MCEPYWDAYADARTHGRAAVRASGPNRRPLRRPWDRLRRVMDPLLIGQPDDGLSIQELSVDSRGVADRALVRVTKDGLRAQTWVYANEGSGFDGLVVFFERMNDGWRGWTGKRQLVIPGRRPGARGESRRTRSTSGDPHGLHRMDCHHRGDPRPRRGVGRRNS